MGIQDRDYWKERYDENLNARRDPRDNPFTSGRSEMSFLGKFIITIAVLLAGALAYRYQTEIVRFLKAPAAVPQRTAIQSPEPAVTAPKP